MSSTCYQVAPAAHSALMLTSGSDLKAAEDSFLDQPQSSKSQNHSLHSEVYPTLSAAYLCFQQTAPFIGC